MIEIIFIIVFGLSVLYIGHKIMEGLPEFWLMEAQIAEHMQS